MAKLSAPIVRLEAVMRADLRCRFDHPHEYELTFMTALPRLHSAGRTREYRARRRRGEVIPAAEAAAGSIVFEALESSVVATLRSFGRTNARTIAALSEVIWTGAHSLVSLVNTYAEFGFSRRELLIDTVIGTMLHGIVPRDQRRRP